MKIPPLVLRDTTLAPWTEPMTHRWERWKVARKSLETTGGLLGGISRGHEFFGLNRRKSGEIVYREWAPAADALFLIGDFNGWSRRSHPLSRGENGVWEISLPGETLSVGSRYKVHVIASGEGRDRIPAYCRRAVQVADGDFIPEFWEATPPPTPLTNPMAGGLRIYEAHVGMAQEKAGVGSFDEFTANTLPRIARGGYNTIQLMAIQEHPYYGSFGYHVSNLFAVSSRFGTPEQLKTLIGEAHKLGIRVLMDLVHSHLVKNANEGLNHFDGTPYQYFHDGTRGYHTAWDSLCWDYKKPEVLRLLLSNVRFWTREFGFDGFRFDGVTSMLYLDHGLGREFSGYPDYFSDNVDPDAVLYLQLASDVVHAANPDAITIAEDVSGMPGLAQPTADGGLGFDYRLAMGVPDFWFRQIETVPDEAWSPGQIWNTLLNRRRDERHVGYVESHDQSIVGDQTLAFRLMGESMYTDMGHGIGSLIVDRGIALHKLIRLVTFFLSGEGWLNFIGNEFGHPEWVDFPRDGNGWSYSHARRQWSLADSPFLRYAGLGAFDAALMRLDETFEILESGYEKLLSISEENQTLVFSRGELVVAINFHPERSFDGFVVPLPTKVDRQIALSTDETGFAGHGRVEAGASFPWLPEPAGECAQSLKLYLPNRTAIVLATKA